METVIGPAAILRLSAHDADGLFDRLERSVPSRPTLFDLSTLKVDEAIIFGDSHGDWHSIERVVARYEEPSKRRLLIGLGDYVDRAPADSPSGTVANALYLLQLAARDPDRVVLIRGNHETVRVIPFHPESLRGEIADLWGTDPRRYERLLDLLGRGPLAAFHPVGPYLAHAGIPIVPEGKDWKSVFDGVDERLIAEITWADLAESRNRRGATDLVDEKRLTEFLTRAGLTFMLRGHDPDVTGRIVFHGRCLTLHTTRFYERYGGVIYARVPLDRPLRSAFDVSVEHVETEGKTFAAP